MYTYKVKFDIINSFERPFYPSKQFRLFDATTSEELNLKVDNYVATVLENIGTVGINDIELVYVKEDKKGIFEKLIERQREFSKKVKEGYFDKLKNNPIKTI